MQPRILLVEDDHFQQSLLRSALVAAGHEVDVASDGLSAVWRIRDGQYDLVLLDYNLPEVDGMAVARLVRDMMGEAARPRLIALTASPGTVQGRELLDRRAFDEVVAKSVDLQPLFAAVARYMKAAPSRSARQAAGLDLLLREWGEYETPPARPAARSRAAVPRILVVEDDDLQRAVVSAALRAEGYEVEAVADGLAGVRTMRCGGFDVALIDYDLPEIDGFATARLITDLIADAVRPRLVAFTAAPDRLRGRTRQWDPVFDELLSKADGPLAMLDAVRQHLRFAPYLPVRQAAVQALGRA